MANKLRIAQIYLVGCLFICTTTACGGGSSGTGESENTGIILDSRCQPIPEINLSDLGIDAVEESSAADGTFTIVSDSEDQVEIPSEPESEPGDDTTVSVDLSEPTCVVISYDDNAVSSVLSFPQAEITECTVAGVQQSFPDDLASVCESNIPE